jgi:hypothetical protein
MATTISQKFNIGRFQRNVVEIGQCWICATLWWPFWKWRLVEICRCQESIRDILSSSSWDLPWTSSWSSYVGRLWCPELIPDIKNFYRSPFSKWPPQYCTNSALFYFNEISYVSIRDIIIYPHMKCRWNRTMLNLCDIVVAILKMATARNFAMSGINSGHHNLPAIGHH